MPAELAGFNVNHGFTEAVVRGLRTGFLNNEDYTRLNASDSLEDLRSALEETDYGDFLRDEEKLFVSTISKKCYEKLADEFKYVKAQTVEPLTTFLDFIQREKMIDNLVVLVQGALNNKAPKDLEDKIHPIGKFDKAAMNMILSDSFDPQSGFDDIYRIFLQDTPIGPYFAKFLEDHNSEEDPQKGLDKRGILSKQDLEMMKGLLKKAWLEDFYKFVQSLGGTTAEVMGDILKTEADFRVLLVSLNALDTHLSKNVEEELQNRNGLWPSFGYLYPEGQSALGKAYNESMIRDALNHPAKYLQLFDQVKSYYAAEGIQEGKQTSQSMEDMVFAENVKMYEMAFEQQYHFGIFYAWVKLREQEISNICWIANMIILQTKDHIDDTIVPIFQPRC